MSNDVPEDEQQSRKGVLKSALHEGAAIETAPIACTDPDCGYVYQYMINAETESWGEVPDYVECGRKDRERPGSSNPYAPEHPRTVTDPCEAPAEVFKDESELHQSDKTPCEMANELYQQEDRRMSAGWF